MYLLLLYTVSPTLLPTGSAKKKWQKSSKEEKIARRIAMIFRVGFISLIAIIIAQPLNVLILSESAKKTLDNYKLIFQVNMLIVSDSAYIIKEMDARNEFHHQLMLRGNSEEVLQGQTLTGALDQKVLLDNAFLTESNALLKSYNTQNESNGFSNNSKKCDIIRGQLARKLEEEIQSDIDFKTTLPVIQFQNGVLQNAYSEYLTAIVSAIDSKTESYFSIKQLLDESNFYALQIKIILTENAWSWAISCGICLLFLLPIYFKYHIRDLSKQYFDMDFAKDHEMRKLRAELLDPIDFPTLERRLLSMDLNQVKTSDFFFQKTLLEYKIVLDDYLLFKKQYSEIFTEKITRMNNSSKERLLPLITKLDQFDIKKASIFNKEVEKETRTISVTKYEYWANHPFKTKRKARSRSLQSESKLLEQLYPEKQ
jgi:hypothetical protein